MNRPPKLPRRTLHRMVCAYAVLLAPMVQADDAVVGTGTAASCTEAAFDAALAQLYPGANFPGGTLSFACGPMPMTIPLTTRKSIGQGTGTVVDGGRRITLDGQSITGIFAVDGAESRVELHGLVLRNGRVAGYGGAVAVAADTSVLLADVDMLDNHADLSGGAIATEAGSALRLERVQLISNTAAHGGGIAANGSVTLVDAYLAGNAASGGEGGALQLWFGTLEVYDSAFGANAARHGGAMLLRGGSATLDDVSFEQNFASEAGGGVALYDDTALTGRDVRFGSNEADVGGGLHVRGRDLGSSGNPVQGPIAHLLGARFTSNHARLGGGVAITAPPPGNAGTFGAVALIDSALRFNGASENGGGLHSDGRFYGEDLSIEGNHADAGGGGIHVGPVAVPALGSGTPFFIYTELKRARVHDNGADISGGGISIKGGVVLFDEVNVTANEAPYGGGLYGSELQLPLGGATFADNVAEIGGGMFIDLDAGANPLLLGNLTFSTNRATGNGALPGPPGGDLYLSSTLASGRVAHLLHATLIGSNATSGGVGDAIAGITGVEVKLTNSVVRGADSGESCASATFVSGGGNVADGGCGATHPTDQPAPSLASLRLGTFGAGNAYVLHYLPEVDSPLVDAAPCQLFEFDQRDLPRGQDGNGDNVLECDSGAIERQPAELPPAPFFSDGFEDDATME